MKIKMLLPLVSVFFISLFLASCSNKEYFSFSASKPSYNKTQYDSVENLNQSSYEFVSESFLSSELTRNLNREEPKLEASTGKTLPVLQEKLTAKLGNNQRPEIMAKSITKPEIYPTPATLKLLNDQVNTLTLVEKKAFKRDVKKASRGVAAATSNILLIILAILLPPLAVAIFEGITNRFWISLLLTLLFFIPGIIYALLVVTGTI